MLRPMGDYIAVRRDAPALKSKGGIELVLATDAAQEPAYGEVIAVGPGLRGRDGKRIPMHCKVGDRVMIGHFGGQTVKVDGQDVVMMRESDLKDGPLGIVE